MRDLRQYAADDERVRTNRECPQSKDEWSQINRLP
jgi:hypothetical protein